MKLKEQEILNHSPAGWRKTAQRGNFSFKDSTDSPAFKGSRFREYTSSHSGFSNSSPKIRINNSFDKRPLRQNSSELSFKGLSLANVIVKNPDQILQRASKVLGTSFQKQFDEVLKHSADRIVRDGSSITFKNKSIGQLLVESMVYPVTRLPFDLIDFSLGLLKKVPFLKNGAENAYNSAFLAGKRSNFIHDEQFNAVAGLFNQLSKKISENASSDEIDNWLFRTSQKNFGFGVGKYNTVHERTLNRVVTGMIPAFFLANDAYNLSRYCDDDPTLARTEQKTRFRQEATRVGVTSYLILLTLGGLTKLVNGSLMGSVLIATIPVLISETFSRLINGRGISFISKETAVDKAKKQGIVINDNKTDENDDTAKQPYKYYPVGVTFAKSEKVFAAFKGNSDTDSMYSFKAFEPVNPGAEANEHKKSNKKTKGLFTLAGLRNAILTSIAIGYALKFAKKDAHFNKFLNTVFGAFKDGYDKLATKHYTIERKNFNKVVETLENTGFGHIADKYRDIVNKHEKSMTELVVKLKEIRESINSPRYEQLVKENQAFLKKFKINLEKLPSNIEEVIKAIEAGPQGEIKLGSVNRKLKPAVDVVIYPFKFIWQTVSLPYNIVENIVKVITKTKKTAKKCSDVDIITNSLRELLDKVQHTKNPADFEKYVSNYMTTSFNNITKSDFSNKDMASLNKLFASTITSWFLIADDYNMVMTKSAGEDKEGAKLKAKERIIQRISAIFYQLMFMNLFNTTFEKFYHSSLLGMASVATGNTLCTEYFTRTSIGKPIVPMTRDEIKAQERRNNNASGLKGAYFRFMSELTGKKSIGAETQKRRVA